MRLCNCRCYSWRAPGASNVSDAWGIVRCCTDARLLIILSYRGTVLHKIVCVPDTRSCPCRIMTYPGPLHHYLSLPPCTFCTHPCSSWRPASLPISVPLQALHPSLHPHTLGPPPHLHPPTPGTHPCTHDVQCMRKHQARDPAPAAWYRQADSLLHPVRARVIRGHCGRFERLKSIGKVSHTSRCWRFAMMWLNGAEQSGAAWLDKT